MSLNSPFSGSSYHFKEENPSPLEQMTRKSSSNLQKREKGMGKCINLTGTSFWNTNSNKYLNRNGILVCVVKSQSVSGSKFWQPDLLTLSPWDHWAFRCLPAGITPCMRTLIPSGEAAGQGLWMTLRSIPQPSPPLPRHISCTSLFNSPTWFWITLHQMPF